MKVDRQNPCETVDELSGLKMPTIQKKQGGTLKIQRSALPPSAPSRSRTYDLMIKSHLLYRLSYRGIADQRSYPAFGRVTRNRMGGIGFRLSERALYES